MVSAGSTSPGVPKSSKNSHTVSNVFWAQCAPVAVSLIEMIMSLSGTTMENWPIAPSARYTPAGWHIHIWKPYPTKLSFASGLPFASLADSFCSEVAFAT